MRREGGNTVTEQEDGPCADCGIATIPDGDGDDEYYMVDDRVWKAARAPLDGFLCIGCLERRLGWELRACYFTDAPVNAWILLPGSSARLRDRLIRGLDAERLAVMRQEATAEMKRIMKEATR
jgi:hypothetical protein